MTAESAPNTGVKGMAQQRSSTAAPVRVYSQITGVGMSVPTRVVTNHHFTSYLETSDEWIQDRTGIKERRWVEPGTGASELAEPACRQAIASAGLAIKDIDAIIVATVTPDYIFPSTACFLQHRLGMTRGFAFDVNAVCSGFIYALVNANALIVSGQARHVLVVGVDIFSHIINPQDRTTCVLFGDGAGAVVLSGVSGSKANGQASAGEQPYLVGTDSSVRGIYASELRSDGAQTHILCVPNGTAQPATPERVAKGEHLLSMAGREVFKLAVRALADISSSVLDKVGIDISEVDYFVSHQANQRILTAVARQLEIPEEKMLSNVAKYGNTSAASLPILLAEAAGAGTIKPGDLVLLSAFGGGVTWGAILLRW